MGFAECLPRAGTCIDPKTQVVQGKTVCVPPQDEYLTDLCLNPIDQDRKPIPFMASSRDGAEHREWLGVNLQDLRAIAADERKLALMPTSGVHRGVAIVAAARSGR